MYDPHALATATSGGLEQHGVTYPISDLAGFRLVAHGTVAAGHQQHTRGLHELLRANFVAHFVHALGLGPRISRQRQHKPWQKWPSQTKIHIQGGCNRHRSAAQCPGPSDGRWVSEMGPTPDCGLRHKIQVLGFPICSAKSATVNPMWRAVRATNGDLAGWQ